MKRLELAPKAEDLYVYQQLEYKEIAEELQVSDRTLRDWGKRGDWAGKRRKYLLSKEATKHQFVDFVRCLLRDVRATLDAGEEPSTTKVTLLKRFGYMILPPAEFRYEPSEREERDQTDPVETLRSMLQI